MKSLIRWDVGVRTGFFRRLLQFLIAKLVLVVEGPVIRGKSVEE